KLDPGKHQVEFRFEPPGGALYISLLGLLVATVLAGLTLFRKSSDSPVEEDYEPDDDFDEEDEEDESESEKNNSRENRKRRGKRRR
ncbi:MAG: hypothetical protein ACPGVU_26120, partial [Limisphaerales bacterium]